MAEIQHLAMCTKNNRRLARFYHYVFGFDGRYEEWRITDPDGSVFEIAEGGWEAGGEKKLPALRYVGIRTTNPEKLANFYQSALPVKEV